MTCLITKESLVITPVFAKESKDFSEVLRLGLVPVKIEIPEMSLESSWYGASHILCQFNFSMPSKIALFEVRKPQDAKFVLCVRWRVGTNCFRYKLWSGVGELLYVPIYHQQMIWENFCIEVWNTIYEGEITVPKMLMTTTYQYFYGCPLDVFDASVCFPVIINQTPKTLSECEVFADNV